jgi:hypothetical protein
VLFLLDKISLKSSGGEEGIRTLDTGLPHTPLAGERLQPLGHLSTAVDSEGWRVKTFLILLLSLKNNKTIKTENSESFLCNRLERHNS